MKPPTLPRTNHDPGATPDATITHAGATTAGAQTGGPEAALRPQPYRAREWFVLTLLVLAIGAALVVMGISIHQNASTLLPRFLRPLAQRTGVMRKPQELKLADPVGSPDALVKAVVVMEHCLEPVQGLLVQIATAYPSQLRAEFIAMNSPAGQKVLEEHKEGCAGVFINGKNRFQVTEDGAPKDIYLHGMPGAGYHLASVAAAIKQEMIAAYGAAAPDFDERSTVMDAVQTPPRPAGGAAPDPKGR